MAPLDPDPALNRRIELCRVHRAPVWNLHHAPARGGAAVTVIVRSCNDGEVQRIRESNDRRSPLLYDADPFRSRVAQFDSIESRESMLLVLGDHVDVTGNRENEQRCRRGHGERRVALGIVPVALWIDRERRVDSDREYVLVLVARFEAGEQRGSVTSVGRIASHSGQRACKTLMVGDVCDIEPRACVPGAIALRREPRPSVPRRVGVTVKVDHDIIGIVHHDCRHRARNHGSGPVNDHDRPQHRECNSGFTQN